VNDFETEIESVKKKLDQIETELTMNQEALESIEIRLRLLKTELDFEADKMV
jgi:chromosome segregation ATPase